MVTLEHDVTIIGTGPAGLAAALAADNSGAKTLLIEHEANLGGMLKQYMYNGFYLNREDNEHSWHEYTQKFINQLYNASIKIMVLTYITKLKKTENGFELIIVNKEGITKVFSKSIIFAYGSQKRNSFQTGIQSRYCAGIFTAGTIQDFINNTEKVHIKNCVIIGANDVGLITAYQLKYRGVQVHGVYEAKTVTTNSAKNICQSFEDFNIPLYTGKTVTRIFGESRLNSVEISSVDDNMVPISGTEEKIDCDTLILAAELIQENILAESLGIPLDKDTGEPVIIQNQMTMLEGIFICSSSLPIYENGEAAGRAAANWATQSKSA